MKSFHFLVIETPFFPHNDMFCCCCFKTAFLSSFERHEVRKYSEVESSVNVTPPDTTKGYYRKEIILDRGLSQYW